jgi:hypothetical protein
MCCLVRHVLFSQTCVVWSDMCCLVRHVLSGQTIVVILLGIKQVAFCYLSESCKHSDSISFVPLQMTKLVQTLCGLCTYLFVLYLVTWPSEGPWLFWQIKQTLAFTMYWPYLHLLNHTNGQQVRSQLKKTYTFLLFTLIWKNYLPFRSTWVHPRFVVGFVLFDL